MAKSRKRKIISYSIDAVLGLAIVFLLSCMVQMFVTKAQPENHGVPRVYGLSFLYVGTDSMEGNQPDSLPKGTGIVLGQAKPSDIKKGDVVTFYDYDIAGGAPNTHRIDQDPELIDGVYHFHTRGDNAAAAMYANVNYEGESFTEKELIGIVLSHNDGLGAFLSFVSPNAATMAVATGRKGASIWFYPLLVLLPLAGIATVSIIDTVREARKLKKEEEAEIAAAMAEAGIDVNDEAAVLAFREKYLLKKEMRETLAKERERERKRALKQIQRERSKTS